MDSNRGDARRARTELRAAAGPKSSLPPHCWGIHTMLRSLIVFSLVVVGGFMFDTSEANAHRRWRVRRPIARMVLGVRRPWRVHRAYYGPRVHVGVGVGYYDGYYGW